MDFERKQNINPTPEELSGKGHERKENMNPSFEEMLIKERGKTARLMEILKQHGIAIDEGEFDER